MLGFARRLIRSTLPLAVRKPLAVLVGRQRWLKGRYWYSMELVRDLADEDPSAFHRFLWANHIGYAESYEIAERFGEANVHESRRMLFADLVALLREHGQDPAHDVRSVFEVGCSMGYLLRHMETHLFPGAETLEGVDIDEYAVSVGASYLREIGSRVHVYRADMADVPRLLEGRTFDVVLCAGTLMYLPAENARAVVRALVQHGALVVLTGPAHPVHDNRTLAASEPRPGDQAFIHNLDEMVEASGGSVLFRRWEGARSVDGNTIYFVLAEGTGRRAHR